MTLKWGSCSTTGIVTLAEDLADQDPCFQDFVIALARAESRQGLQSTDERASARLAKA